MKVLFINSVCGIRSTGRIVASLAEQFKADGHECMLAYGRETVPTKYEKEAYRIGTYFDVRINALKARIFDNEGFNAKHETRKFLRLADAYDPDIVWLHNLHGYYINIEMLFNWIKKRPEMKVFWTLHDCWAFTGHCAHFAFVGCKQWMRGCKKCCQSRVYPKSLFYDNCNMNFLRKKDTFCGVRNMRIITPSKWLAGLVKESFLKDYPVQVIPNTIDTAVFKPSPSDFRLKYGLERKKVILGVASAWSERKGLGDFIKLSEMLDNSYATVLIGLTKKQAAAMPKNIICIDRTDSKAELAQIYTAADVLVSTSREESFGMTMIEAQACGTPAITYDAGGSAETVAADCVIECGNLEAMICKIKKLTENK